MVVSAFEAIVVISVATVINNYHAGLPEKESSPVKSATVSPTYKINPIEYRCYGLFRGCPAGLETFNRR
jgi:hypothetical protein